MELLDVEMGSTDLKELSVVFNSSDFLKMRREQKENARPFTVLFTDIDNTFYRSDCHEASVILGKEAKNTAIPIVAVTGNDFESVRKRIQEGQLPNFEIIAGAVGTELWILKKDKTGEFYYAQDDQYAQKMVEKGFDRKKFSIIGEECVKELNGNTDSGRLELDFDFQHPEVELEYRMNNREDQIQPFKVSFYSFATLPEDLVDLRKMLEKKFLNQKVLICEEIGYNSKLKPGESRKKYCIDILPVTKAEVVQYLGELTSVEISVVAGDSGNDAEMLIGSGDIAIIVGGAKPELEEEIDKKLSGHNNRRHFERVVEKNGKIKLVYRERGKQLGPESIARAAKWLRFAQNLNKKKSGV